MKRNMRRFLWGVALAANAAIPLPAQEGAPAKTAAAKEAPAPRSKDGKKLFTALDTLRVQNVGAAR